MAVMAIPLAIPATGEPSVKAPIAEFSPNSEITGRVMKFVTVYAAIGFCPHQERILNLATALVSNRMRKPVTIEAMPVVVSRYEMLHGSFLIPPSAGSNRIPMIIIR